MKFVLATLLLLASFSLQAELLEVGQPLPSIQLKDAFDKDTALRPATRVILFSADKMASDLIKQAMDGKNQAYLDQHQIQIVADISAMPALVTKMFALPKLRKRPYTLLLGNDEATLQSFPRQQKSVTLIRAENGNVLSLEYLSSGEALAEKLP